MSPQPHSSPVLLLLAVVLAFAVSSPCQAADPAFVGVLALTVDDEVAKELQLTDEVRAQLEQLIERREAEVLDMVLSLPKNITERERRAKLQPFVEATEQEGLALLSDEQQARLLQIRVARIGATTLAATEVADQLKLTPEQRRAVSDLLAKRARDLTRGGEEDRRITRAFYERQLMLLLSESQRAAWEKLAGVAAGGDAIAEGVAPTPPNGDAIVAAPPTGDATADRPTEPVAADEPTVDGDAKLTFQFKYASWEKVLTWFAEQADLSLVLDAPPPGTFNYQDTRSYTPAEALDLMNSVLLTKGYTLVRRDRMLMVINLEDGIPPNLVRRVPLDDLDEYGEYELVSCLFQLSRMSSEDAEKEIRKMLGPQGDVVVLPKSRAVLVTETAGKLRTIRQVFESAEQPEEAVAEDVTTMAIKHATAHEVLVVARQLLGLPEEQNTAPDGSIRIAVDPLGSKFFVTGKPEMIERFAGILELVDVPTEFDIGDDGVVESAQLEVYTIPTADPPSVLQVLQTLLAGEPDIRLALDPKTDNLIAMGRPSAHETIVATLAQMQRDGQQVEVIRLRVVDPQLAVLSINRLFGGGEEGGDPKAPIVDADPNTRQLLIRGTQTQIDQIRGLLEKMGESESEIAALDEARGGNVRMLPITGRTARLVMQQVEELWPTMRRNRIRVVSPSAGIRGLHSSDRETPPFLPPDEASPPQPAPESERPAPAPADDAATETGPPSTARRKETRGAVRFRFAATNNTVFVADAEAAAETDNGPADNDASLPDVVVSITPGGLLIASEDLDALDELEALLTTLADRALAGSADFTVFYLKYAKAEIAAELLQEVLGAGSGDADGGGGMFGDIASAALGDSGGMLGALLGLGGGPGGGATATLATTGAVTIVPDLRLNALIVQANPSDLDLIEQLLEVVDRETSPEEVEAVPTPRLIPVVYTNATEISQVVRQVFSSRIESASGSQRQPSPEEFIRALRGGRGQSSRKSREDTQKMTIGVDERSNSLVVSAPDDLFRQVEQLVKQLDQASVESEQTLRVVTLRRADPATVQQALLAVMGDSVRTNQPRASASTATGGQSAGRSSNGSASRNRSAPNFQQQMQQRMQMLEALRRSQTGGGNGPQRGFGRPSGR
jgi:type II secretory pathway component GspD/PulD (secretin)